MAPALAWWYCNHRLNPKEFEVCDLAKALHCSSRLIYFWIEGQRNPTELELQKIKKYMEIKCREFASFQTALL